MERFESRLRVRELLRGRPSAVELAEALGCVERSPEQFEHPRELADRLRGLAADPAQASAVSALLPPVSRDERAALERRRAEAWSSADGAWGLGGE